MPQDRRTEKLEEACTPTHTCAHSWVSWAGCRLHSPVSRRVYTGAGAGKALTTYTHQQQGLEKWDTAGKRASLCAPTMVWYLGCRTQVQDIPTSIGWRDPCTVQASLDQHWDAGTVFEQLYLLARWYQGCASVTTGMELLSSSCSFRVCCLLGPCPPPMAVWGGGEGLKGVMEAKPWASRQTQSPGGSHQGLGKASH